MRFLRTIGWLALCACGRLGFDDTEEALGPPGLSYPAPEVAAVLGRTKLSLTPTASHAMRYSVEPGLPAGLELDPATGTIAGTPTEIADEVDYVVTGTAADASARTTLRLTVLPGSIVDTTVDAEDDDGGVDDICYSGVAKGCTLRAAVQTGNRRTARQLVLLEARSYVVGAALEPIQNDLEIAGPDAAKTEIRPTKVHPGYGLLVLATRQTLRLKRATFRDFGLVDGAVIHVSAGRLEVDAARFENNWTSANGGVLNISGGAYADLRRSTFVENVAGDWGGVIHGEGSFTEIVVDQCTAMKNRAPWGSFSHITSGTSLRLQSSTLYGNVAQIAGVLATPGGVYTLINDTIVFNTNTNTNSAGIYLHSAPCEYTVANTILAFNTDSTGAERNCHINDPSTKIVSRGGNLVSDQASDCETYFNGPGDRLAVDPGLEPAAPGQNGGLTETVLLVPGSRALDAAVPGECPAQDQRGVPRPDASGRCDVGAVEMP